MFAEWRLSNRGLLLFLAGVILVLLIGLCYFGSNYNQKKESEEAARYELVAEELKIPKKHILIEEKPGFIQLFHDDEQYYVYTDHDSYTVQFNDDFTELKTILKR
ncbi:MULTISPECIES: hypothetical protein [Bacillus]|uniref:hypothetical protein n=1 Tax=Bacillus amyloliquefaciens group TaxID=1938374 RepID=UPI0039DF6BBA